MCCAVSPWSTAAPPHGRAGPRRGSLPAITTRQERKEQNMRFLVLGAGAVGGYFGGRLAEAGRDVTFLVRGPRAAALGEHGLTVASPLGDFQVPVKVATADRVGGPYDLILLTAKHYDLDAAI